jgi:hypothetical protein
MQFHDMKEPRTRSLRRMGGNLTERVSGLGSGQIRRADRSFAIDAADIAVAGIAEVQQIFLPTPMHGDPPQFQRSPRCSKGSASPV